MFGLGVTMVFGGGTTWVLGLGTTGEGAFGTTGVLALGLTGGRRLGFVARGGFGLGAGGGLGFVSGGGFGLPPLPPGGAMGAPGGGAPAGPLASPWPKEFHVKEVTITNVLKKRMRGCFIGMKGYLGRCMAYAMAKDEFTALISSELHLRSEGLKAAFCALATKRVAKGGQNSLLARLKPHCFGTVHLISFKIMQNNLTSKTRDALVQDVGKLKRNAVQVAQDVQEHAAAHVDQTKQRVTDAIQTAQEALTTHPLALLGIGFGIGFLFGLRFRR